jgi:nicotinate-nucleotide--dimethylbenzimidazole phosphoribosyltransferase
VVDLLELSAEIRASDAEAAATARTHARPDGGRLTELAEWLAAVTGTFPPQMGKRVRMALVGNPSAAVAELAAAADVGIVPLGLDADPAAACDAGVAAADAEIDGGADLLLLAAADPSPASGVVVSLLTGAEPVALLPRGAAATDSAAWIAAAGALRDLRRRSLELRHQPAKLLAGVGSPALAAACGFALRAVARRTPLLLDGTAALAAALLCHDLHPRAAQWWQVADTSADPAHARAVQHLVQRPVLDLGAGTGRGLAGLLVLPVLRAAVVAGAAEAGDE